jgi:hypothetical protein
MFAKSEIRMSKSEIPQCGTKPEVHNAVAAGNQLAGSNFGFPLAALSRRRSGSDFGFRYSELPIA